MATAIKMTKKKSISEGSSASMTRDDHFYYIEYSHRIDNTLVIQNEKINSLNEKFDLFIHQMDKRFEQSDKRFEDMNHNLDKRFEQVDKRFEETNNNMNRRFDQVDKRFNLLTFFMSLGFTVLATMLTLFRFIPV